MLNEKKKVDKKPGYNLNSGEEDTIKRHDKPFITKKAIESGTQGRKDLNH